MVPRPIKTIAIIGAGNGGCAAAAQLTQRGFDIRLYSRSRTTTEPLSAIGGVEYEGALGDVLLMALFLIPGFKRSTTSSIVILPSTSLIAESISPLTFFNTGPILAPTGQRWLGRFG